MALRLLGRKLMIVKPQKLGFGFRNISHTAVHDNPPLDPHARIRRSVNMVYVLPNQYEDDGENRRLNEENHRLKEENSQLIENCRLKEENRRLIERLKTVEEEIIGDLQHDTNKDDASNTINESFEKVTRLEENIFGDLHRDKQNERDGWKPVETKLDEALQKMEEMNKEQHHLRCTAEENLIAKLEIASKTMNELNQRELRVEMQRNHDLYCRDGCSSVAYTKGQAFS
ncbi:uncharacterized protein LOC131309669 [Rhododendron vialii]|uniref:uncharacterized protein LOC131309669 n=1 Tax=Rhododendron vialii TaxID=182163 RepID=UPI00265DF25E|nr:uncharacterized protein LOC131309669 [Rhododendron vialii]